MANIALIIDIGTSVLKVAAISDSGDLIAQERRIIDYALDDNFPGAQFLDPQQLLNSIKEIASTVITQTEKEGNRIVAILPTSQRLGFAFINNDGKCIYAIPNIDRRATREAASIPFELSEKIYSIGGRWPSALHLVSKLKWIQANDPDLYKQIGKVCSFSDWLVYELSGKVISEPTTACETALFDIQTHDWSESLIQAFGFCRSLFPPIVPSGTNLGRVTTDFARSMSLGSQPFVIVGGGDTEFGVVGSGISQIGDVAVIAGSSAPIEMLVDYVALDSQFRTIVNPGISAGTWLLESNAMLTGISWAWVKDLLFPDENEDGFAKLDLLVADAFKDESWIDNSGPIGAVFGPSIMHSKAGNFPKNGGVIIPFAAFMQGKFGRKELALLVLESIVFAIKANLEQISEVSNINPGVIHVAGGMNRRAPFRAMLKSAVEKPVKFQSYSDATILGGAMIAFVGSGIYESLIEANTAMNSGLLEDEKPSQPLSLKRYENWKSAFNLCKNGFMSSPKN